MYFNEKGIVPLLALLVGGVVLVLIFGAFVLGRRGVESSKTSNNSSTSSPIATVTTSPLENSSPEETSSPAPAILISKVSQPICSSTSCANITTLVIDGSNFASSNVLNASGQTNGNPYQAALQGVNNSSTEIIFSFQSLPCQYYQSTLSDLNAKSAIFTFKPVGCP